MSYDHKAIDKKWQDRWEAAGIFHAQDNDPREKFYTLVEFPYPSGAGLHVGHPRSYTALDVVSRKKRMEGKNVLFPMGWDAFGLPAENYAIKTGVHPEITTKENIDTFRRQLQAIGFSFDWSREFSTTDPAYYKWTQWMFLQFFKAGHAYKAKAMINWCPKDKCGLANEEVIAGACERCGTPVEKREKEQWMIAITKYADRLIDDLATVNYLPKIKKQQEDWIGRSEGAEIEFGIDGRNEKLTVFTTRPDTVFGVTYVVLAPEHPLVAQITTADCRAAVEAYVAEAAKKTDMDRGDDTREKTGVPTGAFAINPVNGEKVPIWVADYVLGHYGTGAVMAVPAHDERDFVFAKKFDLPIRTVVFPYIDVWDKELEGNGLQSADTRTRLSERNVDSKKIDEHFLLALKEQAKEYLAKNGCVLKDGFLFDSGEFSGLLSSQARETITAWLEEKGAGRKKITYKLRDWVFSRQRYWGEPIPLVHCEKDGWVAVPDSQLPVVLPKVEKYEPTDNGESPLAVISDFVNTKCPQCGGPAKRETDTMPNWAGSSWYFLRYIDPKNDEAFAAVDKLKYWMPVDLYNGGMEHTTLHLLYSRFWNKFLFDQGLVPTSEPYARRHSHGLILADDGTKMSKSKGNVVNPDEIVGEFGADTFRVNMLFIGPFEEPAPWSTNGVIGVRRFLDRVVRMAEMLADAEDVAVTKQLHKTIARVTNDIEGFGFNTAVAALMTFVNEVYATSAVTKDTFATFLKLLAPFAPHIANELWEKLGHEGFAEMQPWPVADARLVQDDEVTISVQVNGKLRAALTVPVDIAESDLIALAKADANVAKFLTGEPKKTIVVPKKIVSFVV